MSTRNTEGSSRGSFELIPVSRDSRTEEEETQSINQASYNETQSTSSVKRSASLDSIEHGDGYDYSVAGSSSKLMAGDEEYSGLQQATHSTDSLRTHSSNGSGRSTSTRHSSDIDESSTEIGSDRVYQYRERSQLHIIQELAVEVVPALLISVIGSMSAGYVLGKIQNTVAFDKIPALFIMVPMLLNLKGNIELNMSTRLSTQANIGIFDDVKERWAVMKSNIDLLLLQSVIVGTCVGLISTALSLITSSDSNNSDDANSLDEEIVGGLFMWFSKATILLSSAIGCAVIGCAFIGLLICFTVGVSHAFGIDPDNVGTPITSSFGDMSTVAILGVVSSVLVIGLNTLWPIIVFVAFALLGVYLLNVVLNNAQMTHHIKEGWPPLVYAAITSSIAGVIVERYAETYPEMASLVPVLNGIGGNIGTVFTARLSTCLHRGRYIVSEQKFIMFVLLIINIPVQIGILGILKLLNGGSLTLSLWFVLLYVAAAFVQVFTLLFLGNLACKLLWDRNYDPDDYVNPFVTGSGDMLGTFLLALVFVLLR